MLFWAWNQGNQQNFNPSLLPKKLRLIFIGMKQKKKNQNSRLKKNENFKTASFQTFSQKFQGLVGLIDVNGIDLAQPIHWRPKCLDWQAILLSKMAPGEVVMWLPWWCHTLVLPTPGNWGLFSKSQNFFIMEKWPVSAEF